MRAATPVHDPFQAFNAFGAALYGTGNPFQAFNAFGAALYGTGIAFGGAGADFLAVGGPSRGGGCAV